MESALATGPNLADVCSFGHQLVPGSDPIHIETLDAEGRKVSDETKLLRRHAPFGSAGSLGPTKVDKLVAYPCAHALPESEVPPEDLPFHQFRGPSYGRGKHLTYTSKQVGQVTAVLAQCPVCLGEPAPADWRR